MRGTLRQLVRATTSALFLIGAASALRPPSLPASAKNAIAAGCAAATLASTSSSAFAAPPMDLKDAITELAAATYPILKAQTEDTFPQFTDRIGSLLLTKVRPDKAAKLVDLGLDAFLSVPPETVKTLEGAIKDSFSDLKTETCDLVPLPPSTLLQRFQASEAVKKIGDEKWTRFDALYGGSLKALVKTNDAICLPPVESLAKLSLAQAEVGKGFGKYEAKQFGTMAQVTLQGSLGLSDVLGLANDAKKLAPSATTAEKARFQKAGKTLEQAAVAETARTRVEASVVTETVSKQTERERAAKAETEEALAMAKQRVKVAQAEKEAQLQKAKEDQARFYLELRAKSEARASAGKGQ